MPKSVGRVTGDYAPVGRMPERAIPLLLGIGAFGLRLATLRGSTPAPTEAEIRATMLLESIPGTLPVPTDAALSGAWLTILSLLDRFAAQPAITIGAAPALPPDPDPLIAVARGASVVLGALAAGLAAAAGARLGGARGAWLAGSLVALVPLALGTAALATPAALHLLAMSGGLYAVIRATETRSVGAGLGAGFWSGLATATGGGGVGLLAGLVVAGVAGIWAWLVAGAVLVALAPGTLTGFPVLPRGGIEIASDAASPLWAGLRFVALGVGLPGALLAILGATRGVRDGQRAIRAVLAATLAVFVVTLLRQGPAPDALAAVLPGVALLAGFGLSGISRGAATTGVLIVTLLFPAFGAGQDLIASWTPTPHARAREWIMTNLPDGSALLVEADTRLPTADGATQMRRLVDEGRVSETRFEAYAGSGKVFRAIPLPPATSDPMEAALFYDPNLAASFPMMLLADLPPDDVSAREEPDELRTTRRLFHEYFRSTWPEVASFPSGRSPAPGVTLYARPPDFEPDLAQLGRIGFVLTRDYMKTLRDESVEFTEWAFSAGNVLLEVRETRAARALLGMVSERAPNHVEARYQFALALALLGEKERALQELLHGLSLDPYHGGIHYQLGILKEESGDVAGAEVEYRAAIQFQDNPDYARTSLGVLLMRLGDLERAEELLRELEASDRDSEAAVYLRRALRSP